jgi:hypothetical protein
MAVSTNNAQFNLGSSNSPTFTLLGGRYGVAVVATFGGGSVDLQILGPDGVTFLSVLTAVFTANGVVLVDMPTNNTLRFAVTTATAAFASINPVKTD